MRQRFKLGDLHTDIRILPIRVRVRVRVRIRIRIRIRVWVRVRVTDIGILPTRIGCRTVHRCIAKGVRVANTDGFTGRGERLGACCTHGT